MGFRRIAGLSAAAVLTLGAAPAAPSPSWIEAPTYPEMAAVYPAKARADRLAGQAQVTCTVTLNGRLSDCAVIRQTPAGYGFDDAAHKLVGRLRAAPGPGVFAGAEVRFLLTFRPEMAERKPVFLNDPTWADLPALADFQATFPKTENGVNHVRVVLACDVAAGGALAGCAVESEDPPGQGYGAGALTLVPKIKVGLMTPEGQPTVGAKVRVPIRYELTPEPRS